MSTESLNRRLSVSSGFWSDFDPRDVRYQMCGARIHVKDATGWVNIGQAAMAIVEMMLFTSFYLIKWADPGMRDAFDTKFLILGICLFTLNLFFAGILHAGLRHESCGLIVADLGWMTVSTTLRGLSVILLIIELVHYPRSASWLSAGLIASLVSFTVQCLSCYILARCANYMRHVRIHRRRAEALAAARHLLVQYWRPPTNRHNQPPPPYPMTVLAVPPTYETATRAADAQPERMARTNAEITEDDKL